MATGTRVAPSSPEDESLEQAIEQTRARVKALEEKLSTRRAAEAAELELLQSQLTALLSRAAAARQAHAASVAHAEALGVQEASLQRGLDRAQRGWIRVIEPALGAVALFFCLLIIGFSFRQKERAIALQVLGLGTGVLVGLAWRAGRRRR